MRMVEIEVGVCTTCEHNTGNPGNLIVRCKKYKEVTRFNLPYHGDEGNVIQSQCPLWGPNLHWCNKHHIWHDGSCPKCVHEKAVHMEETYKE